ncbi:hypothetical protein ACE2AJ_11385 [Aquihabitans daechungensis]|uniref:hypothetical protein n=1 Tax=Aquihabitans daechungensis TaxID=1052257 RepID=UPI003BA33E1C
MRVFVLSPGRCGSTTFSRGCEHLTNFTTAHESNRGLIPPDHLDYPDGHIEVDNRLSWFLGPLAERHPDARYVHLHRNPDEVTASYLKRWPADPRRIDARRHPVRRLRQVIRPQWNPGTRPGNGITAAFAYPLMARADPWPEGDRATVVRYYVDTVNANIAHFLRDKPSMNVAIESLDEDFEQFWEWIGGEGDRDAARRTLGERHNRAGFPAPHKPRSSR